MNWMSCVYALAITATGMGAAACGGVGGTGGTGGSGGVGGTGGSGGVTSATSSSTGGGGPGVMAGITGCAAIFVDDDGICRPSIDKCAAGTIPRFDTGCVPACIPSCAKIFLEDDGVCHASESKCKAGEIPVPSEGCVPIDGPEGCGIAPWGPIADDPTNVYVDPSYVGGASDGTKGAPFVTIADALAASSSGARVVLAAGSYAEPIDVQKPLEIAGRCASMVTITGTIPGTTPVAVRVGLGVGPVKLRRVQIASAGLGVLVKGKLDLDAVWIKGTTGGIFAAVAGAEITAKHLLVQDLEPLADGSGGDGIGAYEGAKLTLDASAIVRARTQAIGLGGPTASTITDTLIEATKGQKIDSAYGYGITAQADVVVKRSVLVGNRGAAVDVVGTGTSATIEQCVIERTIPAAPVTSTGFALLAQAGGTASLAGCYLGENASTGIGLFEKSKLTMTGSILRGTTPNPKNKQSGIGIGVLDRSTLTLDDSALIGNVTAALACSDKGTSVTVHGTLFQGTKSNAADGTSGFGVSLEASARGTFERVAIRGNRGAGLFLLKKAEATITSSLIEETTADATSANGVGILASEHAALSITSTQILTSVAAGVLVHGGPVKIDTSIVRGVALGRVALASGKAVEGIGDGLLVVGALVPSVADLSGSLFTGAARAGLLFADAGGSIHGTAVTGNQYGLVLQGTAAPEVGADSTFTDNAQGDRIDGGTLPTP